MRFALVSPARYLTYNKSSYLMVEPRPFLEDPEYRLYYRKQASRGAFIMVDNGEADRQNGIDPPGFHEVLDIANELQANEVVMPDRLYDANWTLAHTTDASWRVPPRNRAIVPQGENEIDWVSNLRWLADSMTFRTICLPKAYEAWEGGRRRLLDRIIGSVVNQDMYDIHYLGFYRFPKPELDNVAAYERIRGVDSGAPVAWAQAGKLLDDEQNEQAHYSLEWNHDHQGFYHVRHNVETMMTWCQEATRDAYRS